MVGGNIFRGLDAAEAGWVIEPIEAQSLFGVVRDVPTHSLNPGGTEGWKTIHRPGSPRGRLARKKGLPEPELPEFQNLSEPLKVK
ncbi:TreTu family toxin [Sulfidibacter corallicola]|uniref:TreTu family toxin n=1 Tax=Sulfidibacter corallicola TaxID=2818388 RepID=UPI003B21A533